LHSQLKLKIHQNDLFDCLIFLEARNKQMLCTDCAGYFTGYTSIKHGSSRYVDTRSNLDACTWRMRVVSEVKYWWERAEDHCMLN
jgi:hypothetical protein